MVYPTPRRAVPSEQPRILRAALAAISPSRSACVFDLDSTLLTNHPRQASIVRQFGVASGDARFTACAEEHIVSWDQRDTLRALGLGAPEVEEVAPRLRAFWRGCFFTSEQCEIDRANPGARDYLEAVLARGGRIIYLTGRPVPMYAGTVVSFRRAGFPLPGPQGSEGQVSLWCKPETEPSDDAWKVSCHLRLAGLGGIACAFDNEPIHINGYKEAFRGAVAVHLDTDHSGRPVAVRADIPSVRDFVLEAP
jgi:hypothetical protein